jgi:hypothetical protein
MPFPPILVVGQNVLQLGPRDNRHDNMGDLRGRATSEHWRKQQLPLPCSCGTLNLGSKAFSSEVDIGSREENASKQKAGARF